MNLIPLIGYTHSEPEETSYAARGNDSVRRLWTLVKFREKAGGDLMTVEFCLKVKAMPDFCGGLMIYSPQIHYFVNGDWGSKQFCNPGEVPTLGSLDWEVLEDNPDRAVDFEAVTGKEYISRGDMNEYGLECIAHAALTELVGRGCHGWCASDTEHGCMRKVHKLMANWDGPVNRSPPVMRRTIGVELLPRDCPSRMDQYVISGSDNTGSSWHNPNSGNDVRIYNGYWEHAGTRDSVAGEACENCYEGYYDEYGYCEECDWSSENRRTSKITRLNPQMVSTYSNVDFIKQARRYEWSNG